MLSNFKIILWLNGLIISLGNINLNRCQMQILQLIIIYSLIRIALNNIIWIIILFKIRLRILFTIIIQIILTLLNIIRNLLRRLRLFGFTTRSSIIGNLACILTYLIFLVYVAHSIIFRLTLFFIILYHRVKIIFIFFHFLILLINYAFILAAIWFVKERHLRTAS